MAEAPRPPNLPPFVSARPGGCTLAIRVVPRAGRTALAGAREGALLVRLAAAPVDGAANDSLVSFLAEVLDVPKRAVRLTSGARSRDKRVEVDDVDAMTAAARLRRQDDRR